MTRLAQRDVVAQVGIHRKSTLLMTPSRSCQGCPARGRATHPAPGRRQTTVPPQVADGEVAPELPLELQLDAKRQI
jgi:hypothetical protein